MIAKPTFPNFSLLISIGQNSNLVENKATVNSIVEKHGGRISVESEPGKATCFTLSLPLLSARVK
ncbi:MAG: hypothetical protein HY867_07255 [Chloroflexi bacterium]|nr:hypothetical protein [Chloroflexota bacterium]